MGLDDAPAFQAWHVHFGSSCNAQSERGRNQPFKTGPAKTLPKYARKRLPDRPGVRSEHSRHGSVVALITASLGSRVNSDPIVSPDRSRTVESRTVVGAVLSNETVRRSWLKLSSMMSFSCPELRAKPKTSSWQVRVSYWPMRESPIGSTERQEPPVETENRERLELEALHVLLCPVVRQWQPRPRRGEAGMW